MMEPQNSPQRPYLNLVVRIAILEIILIALSLVLGPAIASVLFPSLAPTMTTNAATATTSALTNVTPTVQFVDAGSAMPTAATVGAPTLIPTPSKAVTVAPQPGMSTATPTRPVRLPQTETAPPPTRTPAPQPKTATPRPKTATPETKTFTITDEQATGLARGGVPANVLQNPAVAFTGSHIEITGMANVPVLRVSGPARVVCKPQVEDEQLRIKVLSVNIGGADVTQFAAAKVEEVVNGSLASLSAGKRVQNAVLSDGSMTVTYLE